MLLTVKPKISLIIIGIFPGFNSIKYIVLDPAKVTKYGFWGALLETLDNKVIMHLFHIVHII